MDNIQESLTKHSLTMNDLVKCTVMLADIKDWPAFNGVYKGYFAKHFPARSAFASNGLALNARVEVECIGHLVVNDYWPHPATIRQKRICKTRHVFSTFCPVKG